MNKLKVLIFIPNSTPGGAEHFLKMIAAHYKDDDVTIVCLTKRKSSDWDDMEHKLSLKYIQTNYEKLGMLKFIFGIFKFHRNYDYIFTSHVYITGLIGILLKLKILKSKNFIARESTSVFLRFTGFKLLQYKLAYYLGYRKIDLLICQTEIMKSQISTYFPAIKKRTKLKVIPNPVNLDQIKTLSEVDLMVNLPKEYIVSAGRLISEKGFDILIKSFNKIKDDFPNFKLVILGDGILKKEIEQLITYYELNNRVLLLGFVDNVYYYFKRAALCVVSSRIEGFPNVLLQMMSQNNRVVSTLCAGGIENIPSITKCNPNDVNELKTAMLDSLKNTNSSENRKIFDDFLQKRSVPIFINALNNELKCN